MQEKTIIINTTINPIKRICAVCRNQFKTSEAQNEILCEECRKSGLKPKTKNKTRYCDKRAICQTCQYRVKLGGDSIYICDCLAQTGESRDLTGDENHCATYCKRKGKKNESGM